MDDQRDRALRLAEAASRASAAADALGELKVDVTSTRVREESFSAALAEELRDIDGRISEIALALRMLARAEDPDASIWREERYNLAHRGAMPPGYEAPTQMLQAVQT